MASKAQMTGMRAVYLVAAELAARGFIVSPTSRSAFGADLLVTNDSCSRSYSVQVKANGKRASFWLVGEKAMHLSCPTHIYVFVNLAVNGGDHEYYVVPSGVVKRRAVYEKSTTGSVWYSFSREAATAYNSKWSLFGRGFRR